MPNDSKKESKSNKSLTTFPYTLPASVPSVFFPELLLNLAVLVDLVHRLLVPVFHLLVVLFDVLIFVFGS